MKLQSTRVDFTQYLSSCRQLPGAGHVERESNNYVEVIVDVGVVTSHLFSPVSARGVLCELTMKQRLCVDKVQYYSTNYDHVGIVAAGRMTSHACSPVLHL